MPRARHHLQRQRAQRQVLDAIGFAVRHGGADQVHLAALQRGHQLRAQVRGDREPGQRPAGQELLKQRREQRRHHVRQRRHAHLADARLALVVDLVLHIVIGQHDAPRVRQQLVAHRRQHDAARHALEQLQSGLALQPRQYLGQRRLGQPQRAGSLVQVAVLGHHQEQSEVFGLHAAIPVVGRYSAMLRRWPGHFSPRFRFGIGLPGAGINARRHAP
ncbi:hypothetical protein FQZ97_968500 [compost metagenome]